MAAARALLFASAVLVLAAFVLPAVRGEAEAEFYFWNELTGDVQWEDPGGAPLLDKDGRRLWIDAGGNLVAQDPHAMEYKWVESWSEEHLRPFYYNQETKHSTWERPADLAWRRIEVQQQDEL